MKEKDVFDELIEIGKKRGMLTYDEINDALPSEFFTPDEIEELMDLLSDMGVKIVDSDETTPREEVATPEYEKTEDLVQAYFHSMGDISILTKSEEVELAKKLEEGKEIIGEIIKPLALTKRIEKELIENEDNEDMEEEEKVNHILDSTLFRLETMVEVVNDFNDEIFLYGESLSELKVLIKYEKSKKRVRGAVLADMEELSDRAQSVFKRIETEVGIKVDQLIFMWERISRVQAFVLEAKNELITRNLRLVVNIAKNYVGRGLPLLDLIQEGNIGLMKAVKNYDPDRGVRLVSFAMHWVRSEIYDYILKNWRIVKVATTKAQRKLFFNLRKSRKRLGWMNQNDVKTLSSNLDVPEKTVLEMESRMSGADVAFDMDSDSDDDTAYVAPAGYLADNRYNPEALYEKDTTANSNSDKLVMALAQLDERSQDIVQQRWLNADDSKATLTELAEKYGVSAERIRQIEKKAFSQMKGELIA